MFNLTIIVTKWCSTRMFCCIMIVVRLGCWIVILFVYVHMDWWSIRIRIVYIWICVIRTRF